MCSVHTETRHLPSGLNATDRTPDLWASIVVSASPVSAFQNLIVWSRLPDAIRCPSGEKATVSTRISCPLLVQIGVASTTSHTVTTPDSSPETIRSPARANATHRTPDSWPRKDEILRPVAAFHSATVPSKLADTSRDPVASRATSVTPSWWPLMASNSSAVCNATCGRRMLR